jgi:hypothetical protein
VPVIVYQLDSMLSFIFRGDDTDTICRSNKRLPSHLTSDYHPPTFTMTWWRRDKSFSPVPQYAQRLLRSHESALRTRCFSRTPPKTAQHEDNNGTKRPAGMSNFEWMQRQHYESVRKILVDDPYNAIFGPSNAMLSGKGFTDWEWINKSFPKWMLREMESHEEPASPSKHGKDVMPESKYPKTVEIRSDNEDMPKKRESHFPQPLYRTTRLDRDDAGGIVSPSDLRRPREELHFKVVGRCSEADRRDAFAWVNPEPSNSTGSSFPPPTRPKSTAQFRDFIDTTRLNAAIEMESSNKAAATPEPSFMNQFLTDESQDQESHTSYTAESGTWRQTALQRRSSPGGTVKPSTEPAPVTKVDEETPNTLSSTQETNRLPSQAKVEATPPVEPDDATHFAQSESSNILENGIPQDATGPVRSTSKILSQLPEDDIDFLSADAIRASMVAKKTKILKDEQREAERLNLEKTFDVHKTGAAIDSMIESKVVNDQHVRRIERQMREPKETPKVNGTDNTATSAEELNLESSVDRMKRWLERGGATFSSIFWQDPAEEADTEKTRLFFDKVLGRIRKGRITMKQVIQDLETDIPVSKPLLKRMKADEELLDSAIHALRQRSGSGKMQPLTPKKLRAIQVLRLKYQHTDRELDVAYDKLRGLGESDAVTNTSPAFKRRLSVAAKITQKNAHLTRYLIWSLQARLEDPEIDQSMLPNYQAVANSLLTLRDTQMALSGLVERAMLLYGVVPKTTDTTDILRQTYRVEVSTPSAQGPKSREPIVMGEIDKAQLRAKIAAEERLSNEVDAQKSAMRGLSDDGYARAPKPVLRKSFEERGPLAHSLFRPFGPVLESLDNATAAEAETKKTEEEATRKQQDATLVAEVRRAYEDTYGPITVGHKQLADATEEVKKEQESDVKKFDMLKDEPISPDFATPAHSRTGEVTISLHGTPGSRIEGVEEIINRHQAVLDPLPTVPTSSTSDNTTEVSAIPEDYSVTDKQPYPSKSVNLQTHYTILIYDPQADKLSLSTSTSKAPRDTSPVLPLHQALAALEHPAKFIPHITGGLEIVTAKKDMLILRSALDSISSSSTKPFETVSPSSVLSTAVNPIDGTTRLSPTGYAGPEESQEQLKQEFDERRALARAFGTRKHLEQGIGDEWREKEWARSMIGKKGRGSAVLKTAIWAAAGCYVVGVLGELASSV